ncbi:uncharacterized protein LOC110406686 isoform X2 [Numida meleagris]|uniref:uncharacterized protein LOC110406686 isoform X2 n=1 Tax=Numida meleagris TaxID=8996 RepID=UPI000B3DF630|nr:uncharacterized protein LOC110406686 isoform X2 [Numida meleagris]
MHSWVSLLPQSEGIQGLSMALLWDEQLFLLTMHCSSLSFPAEQAAILEKLAAELVKRTKEVEKKNSQLKKHCEDMEEQRKKSGEFSFLNQRDLGFPMG